ncbi:MAG TPA: MASE1 domain-containing protein [Casimicrobiaceae bacterium]|jgi:integral membrane sensor domain MASE1|nr:MASE1 domain-containing protein [Casimicrobiaceae bacterium]
MEASLYADRDGRRSTTAGAVAVRAVLAAIAYVVALLVSYYYGGGFGQEATIWLASGVAIGVLAAADTRRWRAYAAGLAIGALVANLIAGESIVAALVYAVEEVAIALLVAWALKRLLGASFRLDSVRNVLVFVVVGAFGGALASWLVNLAAYPPLGEPSPLLAWRLWIVSGSVGTLIVTPLILTWADFRPKRSGGATMVDFAWGGPLFLLVVLSTIFVFHGETAARFSGSVGYSITYLPFVFLVLGALVWGPRGATLSTFVLAAIAVVYTVRAQGPFAGVEGFLGEAVLEVQGYVAAAALMSLLVSALTASRQVALREAASWKTRYEAAIVASGQALYELDPASGRLDWSGDTRRLGFAGQAPSTLAGYLERVHSSDREAVHDAFIALARGTIRHSPLTHRLRSGSGEDLRVDGDANAIVDFDDSVHRVVGFLRASPSAGAPVERRAA